MSNLEYLRKIKEINFDELEVSLAFIKSRSDKGIFSYSLKYVDLEENIFQKIKDIVKIQIQETNHIEDFQYDNPIINQNEAKIHNIDDNDFNLLIEEVKNTNPEEEKIINDKDLFNTKGYLIIFKKSHDIFLITYNKPVESWKLEKKKNTLTLFLNNSIFKDLNDKPVFRLSKSVDLFCYEEKLLIFNFKNFQNGLRFKEGMKRKNELFYDEAEKMKLFSDINIIKEYIGEKITEITKITSIYNLGYYNNNSFMSNLKKVCLLKTNWNIEFNDDTIIVKKENVKDILQVLQNKRLWSELSENDFDVSTAKALL